MGVRTQQRRSSRMISKLLGRYTLHGREKQPVLTVPTCLAGENPDFPAEPGSDVEIELVEPDDGETHLRVYPASDEC